MRPNWHLQQTCNRCKLLQATIPPRARGNDDDSFASSTCTHLHLLRLLRQKTLGDFCVVYNYNLQNVKEKTGSNWQVCTKVRHVDQVNAALVERVVVGGRWQVLSLNFAPKSKPPGAPNGWFSVELLIATMRCPQHAATLQTPTLHGTQATQRTCIICMLKYEL